MVEVIDRHIRVQAIFLLFFYAASFFTFAIPTLIPSMSFLPSFCCHSRLYGQKDSRERAREREWGEGGSKERKKIRQSVSWKLIFWWSKTYLGFFLFSNGVVDWVIGFWLVSFSVFHLSFSLFFFCFALLCSSVKHLADSIRLDFQERERKITN